MQSSNDSGSKTTVQHQNQLTQSRWRSWLFGLASLLTLGVFTTWILMAQPWTTQAQSPRSEFASDRDDAALDIKIDSKRAMGYLRDICKIGPRISGTDGMKKQQELIQSHFENLGLKVEYQRFQAKQNSQTEKVSMANMIISFHPDRPRRIIICSHYDTRPIADQERNENRWQNPFISANDGGSGVALMMELAHHMKDLKTNVGVDFVLFDGEEYVFRPRGDDYFFGSKHFGAEVRRGNRGKVRYIGAVLLDMIAGKNVSFPVEQNSAWLQPQLVREIYQIAAELKCSAFKPNEMSKVAVEDDHMALNRAGIPAIDLIDFDYPHWHKLTDLPENCFPDGMEQVARVLLVWMQRAR